MHVECLERVAQLQQEHLGDPEGAYATTKTLLRRLDDPLERADEFEAMAEAADRWDDVAQFYEGLLVDGHGGPDFVERLATICRVQLDDASRAIRMFQLAASHDPDATTYDAALIAMAEEGEAWETLLGYHRAIAEAAERPSRIISARRAAGRLRMTHLERPDAAARELEAAADLAPEDIPLAEELAEALRAAGERRGLIAHYQAWLARADEDLHPNLRCRLASVMLTDVIEATEGVRLIALELDGPAGDEAQAHLTRFLRESTETGEAWRRPVEKAAAIYTEALGDEPTKAALAIAEAARLRVLPEGPEQHERRLTLAELLVAAGDEDAGFIQYSQALRDAMDAPKIEASLEALAESLGAWKPLAVLYAEIADKVPADDVRARLIERVAHLYREQLEDMSQAATWFERLLEERPGTLDALTALATHYAETRAYRDEARILEAWRRSDARMGYEGDLARRLAVVRMDG
ncbi:MAG: hypothetical protein QF464_15390, partial [Myxococcota bacterium]|nr:hypothetical protein [Myxococcota bacterium]